MPLKDLFKSKEQKALEAKMAIRRSVQELKKSDKSIDRKKEDMIKHAQEAKRQGITQQYNMALNGLKMLLGYQKRIRAMILQIQITESMQDVVSISSDFTNLVGNVSKRINGLVKGADFAKNAALAEMGMMQVDNLMGELDGFMESMGMSMEEMTDEEMTEEVERLIDVTGASRSDPVDDEIARQLASIQEKKSTIEG